VPVSNKTASLLVIPYCWQWYAKCVWYWVEHPALQHRDLL
jgi:hypothetical protein